MRFLILCILLFLSSCSSAPSGSIKNSGEYKRFSVNNRLYDVGYIYENYVKNSYNQYRVDNYCTGGIFLISYSYSKKKFVEGGSLKDARTERICITKSQIFALYDSRLMLGKSYGKDSDLECWEDNNRLLSKDNPSNRGDRPYDACNSQFALIDKALTAGITGAAAILTAGIPILLDPLYTIPGNYKNHFRFFSPSILAEAVRQSGILKKETSYNQSKSNDFSIRKSQNPSINNKFSRAVVGEEYPLSVMRVKRKLRELKYFNGTITNIHDTDLSLSLTAFLSDEGLCSSSSKPSRNKKTEILPGEYCRYYFTGVSWIPLQLGKIIESKKLDNLLNSAILRIKEE